MWQIWAYYFFNVVNIDQYTTYACHAICDFFFYIEKVWGGGYFSGGLVVKTELPLQGAQI